MTAAISGSARVTPSAWRVLLVDDSRDDADLTEFALRDGGLLVECRRAHSARSLEVELQRFDPQIVLSDLNMPGFSGAQALAQVRAHAPTLPFVFLTGTPTLSWAPPPSSAPLVLKDALHTLPDMLRRLLPAQG